MNDRPWDSPFPSRITPSQVRQWVSQYPTPFYVYDLTTLYRRIREVKAFPHPSFSQLTPRYALKANPNRTLIRILDEAGISFDASSGFEVERLLHIGISPEKIMLTAQQIPSPEEKFLRLFRQGLIYNATSLRQLEWYGRLGAGKTISLRINPGFGSGMHAKTTVGGEDSGFGIWHEYYPKILSLCQKYQLNVERIHTHVGSGSDPQTWGEVAAVSLDLLKHFPTAHTLNLGGGFKVGRHPGEHSANLRSIGKEVSRQLEGFARKASRTFNLEIEPGTYYVAEPGLLIAQVEDVISTGTRNKKHFIKLNCGMNDLIRPTLYHSQHHIDILPNPRRNQRTPRHYIVIGHCCESGDQISQQEDKESGVTGTGEKATILSPPPDPGDPVIIHGTGAYGSAMASRYNSYPFIAEYLYDGGLRLIREAETLAEMMDKEIDISSSLVKKPRKRKPSP